MPELSQLKIYSVGKAAEDLKLGTDMLEVFCIEDQPNADNEVTANATTYSASGESATGEAYKAEMQTTSTIKCKWLAFGDGNRQTPPNVCRGERIVVYRFGNSTDYYWLTLDADLKFRKLETVVWAFSGTTNRGDSNSTADNTYFFEVSTHKGMVRLKTSKMNKEPFGWEVLLNTKEGYFTIRDDADQVFALDSAEKLFRYSNSVGSVMEIMGKTMRCEIPDSITQKTKEWVVEAETGKMTFKNHTVNADKHTVNAETQHNGNLTLAGSLACSGGGARSVGAMARGGGGTARFSYPVIFEDNVTMNSSVTVNATLTADKLVSKGIIDAPGGTWKC